MTVAKFIGKKLVPVQLRSFPGATPAEWSTLDSHCQLSSMLSIDEPSSAGSTMINNGKPRCRLAHHDKPFPIIIDHAWPLITPLSNNIYHSQLVSNQLRLSMNNCWQSVHDYPCSRTQKDDMDDTFLVPIAHWKTGARRSFRPTRGSSSPTRTSCSCPGCSAPPSPFTGGHWGHGYKR